MCCCFCRGEHRSPVTFNSTISGCRGRQPLQFFSVAAGRELKGAIKLEARGRSSTGVTRATGRLGAASRCLSGIKRCNKIKSERAFVHRGHPGERAFVLRGHSAKGGLSRPVTDRGILFDILCRFVL